MIWNTEVYCAQVEPDSRYIRLRCTLAYLGLLDRGRAAVRDASCRKRVAGNGAAHSTALRRTILSALRASCRGAVGPDRVTRWVPTPEGIVKTFDRLKTVATFLAEGAPGIDGVVVQ